MKIETKQLIEIAGITGVIASLIFVGMQLRQDRRVAIASQYSARAESVKADYRTRLESDSFISARSTQWENGRREDWWTEVDEQRVQDSGISWEELVALQLDGKLALIQFDNLYFQYTQGLLSKEFWVGARESLKNALRSPATAAFWSNHEPRIPIMNMFDELIAEIESGN